MANVDAAVDDPLLNDNEEEEERRRRLRRQQQAAAMEQMLLAAMEQEDDDDRGKTAAEMRNEQQQQQQQQQQQHQGEDGNPNEAAAAGDGGGGLNRDLLDGEENVNNEPNNNAQPQAAAAAAAAADDFLLPPRVAAAAAAAPAANKPTLSYRQGSFLAAAVLLFYAFRTRQQYYLAIVFLSSSKWAYVVLGNAFIALLICIFDQVTRLFLQGLRLQEAEGLHDFFRWNVTETCLALTMFRAELDLKTAIQFLILILVKCLHQVAALREQHIRMTEDAIVPWSDRFLLFPCLQSGHIRLLIFFVLLQFLDLAAAQHTVHQLMTTGPSVNILFAFESAILLISAWSHLLLWHLNVLDSLLHFGHDRSENAAARRLLHPWKEYKATLIFAVELQAQAVQFLFYLTFFSIVLTYYGMPVNLFREVYISFAALKERLTAFFTYRQLMASMNRFPAATQEELDEAGPCIICRDEMTVQDCKRLPACRHIFHKSCLREWLVQQQSCPTCRSDIASMRVQPERPQPRGVVQEQEVAEPHQQQQQQEQQQDQVAAAAAAAEQSPEDIPEPSTGTHSSEPDELIEEREEIVSPVFVPRNQPRNVRFAATAQEIPRPLLRTYPALYRVTKESGAQVSVGDTALRTIPQGYLVVCQGEMIKYRGGQRHRILRIPDGFVSDNAVTLVKELPGAQSR